MIKIIYEVKDDGGVRRKVDYIPVKDFPCAYSVFMERHGLSRPVVLGMLRIYDTV